MSLPIPFLDAHPSVQQALDFIAQRFPLGKRDLSNEVLNNLPTFGVAVVGTSGASPYSATVTVPHSLGRVPTSVVATANGIAGAWSVTGPDATDFELQGYKTDGGNWPGNINTYWIAI